MMIDTIRVKIPVEWGKPLYGGKVLSTKFADGMEVREYEVLKHESFEGSYSSSLHLRCIDGRELELYGSCSKWLTGHNLFGSCDLFGLLRRSLDRLHNGPLASLPAITDDQIRDASISRIDVNEMFSLNSLEDVRLYIKVASGRMTLARRGEDKKQLSRDGNTLSWGMHKGNRSAWKTKIYAKGPEARVRRKGKPSLPERLVRDEVVMGWVDKQVRVEHELHGRDLDRLGLRKVGTWNVETARSVWSEKVGLFFWGDEPVEVEVEQHDMSVTDKNTMKTYDAWRAGRDLRAYYSPASFKRWRARIRKQYGCDISLPAPEAKSNVVAIDFKRVLELNVSDPGAISGRIDRLLAA